jgi:tetratricopeptide (TPR) repeat protein
MQVGRIYCHETELQSRWEAKLCRSPRDANTHYWGQLRTRGYLRALYNWAQLLYQRRQFQSALAYAKESLLVNPNDNTGTRYLAYSILRLLGDKSAMKKLARQYTGESLPHEADELEVMWFGNRFGQPQKKAKPN